MTPLLRRLSLGLLLSLALSAVANETISKNEFDTQKELLQQKIESGREIVQKDLDSLKVRIDAFDKRIDDQNNRVGDIGQSVDRFAVIVSIIGVLVTVLLAFGGLVGYISVARKVAEEAKTASQKWFDDNQNNLASQIHELEKATEQAHQKIDNSVNDVEQHSDAAIEQMQKNLNASKEQTQPISPIEQQALHQSAALIRGKPEASYSFEDWNKRAFDAYNSGQFEDAALHWKNASNIPNAGATNTTQALFNRGVTLNLLKRLDEACITYEQLIATYLSDNTPAIREQVAKAMLNMGLALKEMKKINEAITTFERLIATYSSDNTPAIRDQVARAMLSKGISLGLMEKPAEEIATYEQIITTYSPDSNPAIMKRVAEAFNGKGFVRLMEAKKAWPNRDQALALLNEAQTDLLAGLNLRTDCGLIRGNLSYVQYLLENRQAAEESFRTALVAPENGGEELYKATLADIGQHPIKEDEIFRTMIENLWAEHQAAKSIEN